MDNDPAVPLSFEARYGAGYRRSLVLGGGGVVFVAWLAAYLGELARRGVALQDADRILGTSAGSILATIVAAGHLQRLQRLIGPLSRRPAIISRLAPAADLNPSQQRALDLFECARDSTPATIREIGAAALAAATPPRSLLPASVLMLAQTGRWPDDRLVVSAVDAYTGERLALTRAGGTPLLRAVAASASVPGLFAPQPVLDRRCMDGGVSGTGLHSDLVAGCERVLVIPVAGTLLEPRLTMQPDSVDREISALRASGSTAEVRHARLPADTDLMDPAAVPDALLLGRRQAGEDAAALSDFWGRE
jgi:NTE family protein